MNATNQQDRGLLWSLEYKLADNLHIGMDILLHQGTLKSTERMSMAELAQLRGSVDASGFVLEDLKQLKQQYEPTLGDLLYRFIGKFSQKERRKIEASQKEQDLKLLEQLKSIVNAHLGYLMFQRPENLSEKTAEELAYYGSLFQTLKKIQKDIEFLVQQARSS